MNRFVWLVLGLSLAAFAAQACGASTSESDDDPSEAGATSSSGGSGSSGSSSSSGGSSSSSSSGATSSSSSASSSSGDAAAGDRCEQAAARAEARYAECDVNVLILDAGTPPPCTEQRAVENERTADCVEAASCPALRGQADASDEAAEYFACIGGGTL